LTVSWPSVTHPARSKPVKKMKEKAPMYGKKPAKKAAKKKM